MGGNGCVIKGCLDSASDASLVTNEIARKLRLSMKVVPDRPLTVVGGGTVMSRRMTDIELHVPGFERPVTCPLHVVEALPDICSGNWLLLGLDFISQVGGVTLLPGTSGQWKATFGKSRSVVPPMSISPTPQPQDRLEFSQTPSRAYDMAVEWR